MLAHIKVSHHNPQRDPIKLWDMVVDDRTTQQMELSAMLAFFVLRVSGYSFAIQPGTKLVIEIEVPEVR